MEFSKALEILENERPGCGEKATYPESEICEAYDLAMEAIEKQIPMERLDPEFGQNGRIIYPCGNCGEELGSGDYCQFCGQKRAW